MYLSLVRCCVVVSLSYVVMGLQGCGSDLYQRAEATGTVMCNGEPAHGGVIRFEPVDAPDETGRTPGEPGRSAYATVQEDGTFTMMMDTADEVQALRGALTGRHRVFFQAPVTRRARLTQDELDSYSEEMIQQLQAKIDAMPVYDPLPCGTKVTPETVEVKSDEDNVFEFTIE